MSPSAKLIPKEEGFTVERTPDGNLHRIRHSKWRTPDGTLHRIGGPAYQSWHENGRKYKEEWFLNGKPHRIGGPANQRWNDSGLKTWGAWYQNGKLHRIGGPAQKGWNASGDPKYETWFQNGKYHRIGGPATQSWNDDGIKTGESWYQNGIKHRIDGPAIQSWNDDGIKTDESWYQNGKKHRIDGPAIQNQWYGWGEDYYKNNRWNHVLRSSEEWYLNGRRYTKAQFTQELRIQGNNQAAFGALNVRRGASIPPTSGMVRYWRKVARSKPTSLGRKAKSKARSVSDSLKKSANKYRVRTTYDNRFGKRVTRKASAIKSDIQKAKVRRSK